MKFTDTELFIILTAPLWMYVLGFAACVIGAFSEWLEQKFGRSAR